MRTSTPAAQFNGGIGNQAAIRLQRMIGNQAVLRLVGNLQTKLEASTPSDRVDQEADRVESQAKRAPEGTTASVSSGAIPLFDRGGDASHLRLQRKLAIGKIDDPLEAEADAVAERVMKSNGGSGPISDSQGGAIRRKCACSDFGSKCDRCKPDERNAQRLRVERANVPAEAPASVDAVLHSAGRPLDTSARAFFESRLGHDFDQVRLHADPASAESAREVGTSAYTVGNHIVFAPGEYAPQSAAGRRLIAHELTHVLQQRQGAPSVQRTPARKVDCSSTAPLKLPSGGSVSDPVAVITAAEQRGKQLLAAAILELDSTRRRIVAGNPAGWPTVSDTLGLGLELMGLDPNREDVWRSTKSGDYTVALLLLRLRSIEKMIGDGSFFFTCLGNSDFCGSRVETPTEVIIKQGVGEAGTKGHNITMCETFWLHGPEEQANTIIHETSHSFAEFIMGGEPPFEQPHRGSDVAACYARFAMLVAGSAGDQRPDLCPDP